MRKIIQYVTHSCYLKAHHMTHIHDKPYTCDMCGKSFMYTKTLHCHEMTHASERHTPVISVESHTHNQITLKDKKGYGFVSYT